jgi:hypothetical protein
MIAISVPADASFAKIIQAPFRLPTIVKFRRSSEGRLPEPYRLVSAGAACHPLAWRRAGRGRQPIGVKEMFDMHARNLLGILAACGLSVPAVPAFPGLAQAYEVEHYYVYCADDRIEVSFWDLEQMMVRRGSDVCLFRSYTSYSDALTFAEKNFGGEGGPCSC